MARTNAAQLNIRSQFARERVDQLSLRTGMTATQIVEEALRTYHPFINDDVPTGLIRKGRILVKPLGDRPQLTVEQIEAFDEETRIEREEQILGRSA